MSIGEAAGVVAAVAALLTVVFAYLTVREARTTRLEEEEARQRSRLERVAELTAEIARNADALQTSKVDITRKLLAVTIAALDLPFELPAVRWLIETPLDHQSVLLVPETAREALEEVRLALFSSTTAL